MKVSRISIVGGGIGGLSAALALQHFGYRVSVFEQARELREIGAGVTITPNAMHALNFLGVGERVAKEAGPTEAYLIRHFQTGEVIKTRANGTDYVERFGATYHQVHRADLHAALADAVLRNDLKLRVPRPSLRGSYAGFRASRSDVHKWKDDVQAMS